MFILSRDLLQMVRADSHVGPIWDPTNHKGGGGSEDPDVNHLCLKLQARYVILTNPWPSSLTVLEGIIYFYFNLTVSPIWMGCQKPGAYDIRGGCSSV